MPLVSPESIDSSASRAVRNSTHPIRALLRGLDALALLNLCERATVAEVAANLRLPRTTTYRILETLRGAGYVRRDPDDERYRATPLARLLVARDDERHALIQCAKPEVHRLCRELGWPVAIATPGGSAMEVREAATSTEGDVAERYSPAFRVPLFASACGRAWLAHCAEDERRTLLTILARSPRTEDGAARDPLAAQRLLADVRDRGYATVERPQSISDEISLAVPVAWRDGAAGALTLRISSSRVPFHEAVARFVPPLRQTARQIASAMPAASAGRPAGGTLRAGAHDA